MTLEQELETAVEAAGRHARPGEQPVAVMAAEPAGARVYVVALAAGEALGYVAVDTAGAPVADRRLVKDAVALAALAERAEEVSGATAADDLVAQFRAASGALRAAGEGEAAGAAEAVGAAGERLGEAAPGLRRPSTSTGSRRSQPSWPRRSRRSSRMRTGWGRARSGRPRRPRRPGRRSEPPPGPASRATSPAR
jgi:hypothetical protein